MKFQPIITSLLDTDFYKFTMGQVVYRMYRNVNVKYEFRNRTKTVDITGVQNRNLRNLINLDELRAQLDHVMSLKFNNSELHYLRGTNEYSERMFAEDYLDFLKTLRLPHYQLTHSSDSFSLEFEGPWSTAIYWETFALSIINELYNRAIFDAGRDFSRDVIRATGVKNLSAKIAWLKRYNNLSFTDFGTRRRFSREWQDYVVNTLKEEFTSDQFRGTSNVYLAMKYGLTPMGTSAHEMYMVLAGLAKSDDEIRNSHNKFLDLWWDQYGYGLSIALTDTFGSDFFFRDMSSTQAAKWKGLRHDSGSATKFADKALAFYQLHHIDPRDKMIVFSDGLDVDTITQLHDHLDGKIKTTFGWGTNLTNDLGIKALSLVVKPTVANSNGLVKLSDNIAKAIGDPAEIERYKRIFHYTDTHNVECRY